MNAHLDLDDCVSGHPCAMEELAALRALVEAAEYAILFAQKERNELRDAIDLCNRKGSIRLGQENNSLRLRLSSAEAQNKKMREALEAIGNARYHKDISDMYATSVVGGGQLSEQIVSDLFHDILWRVEEYETIARASLLP